MIRPFAYSIRVTLNTKQYRQLIDSLEKNIEGNTSQNQAIIRHTISKFKEAWDEQDEKTLRKH